MQILHLMSKEQLQLLIGVVAHTSFAISDSDNLALEVVKLDNTFEYFGFDNPINKLRLATDTVDYTADLINPVLNPIIDYYESLYGKIS